MMPWVTASESGSEQTESSIEKWKRKYKEFRGEEILGKVYSEWGKNENKVDKK